MRTTSIFASLALVALITVPGSAADPAADPVHKAIERGLNFLVEEGTGWMKARKCASCHHAPAMLWALNEAQLRGYAFDRQALAEVTAWALADDNRAKVFPKPGDPIRGVTTVNLGALVGGTASRITLLKPVSQAPLFLALGMRPVAPANAAALGRIKRLIEPLLGQQAADGTWSLTGGGRPPLVGNKEIMTLWAALALTPTGASDPAWVGSKEKALRWLAATPPGDSHQAIVLRLLVEERLGATRGDGETLVRRLLQGQNADGGWSQDKDRGSDAYATGQSLYVLGLAGMAGEVAARRAQAYLVKTQATDGSWDVASRPDKPGGKGSKNNGPISYVGTAWAALGLMATAPTPPAAPRQKTMQK